MVALRGNRPFSLDDKVADLERHLPTGRRPCEIRLLAVERAYRKTSVFAGLVLRLLQVARARGYDLAVISGTTRQAKLYHHLGFEPFAAPVGSADAMFQPMLLTLERFERQLGRFLAESYVGPRGACLLPGPVQTTRTVRECFAAPALSHRDEAFVRSLGELRRRLCELTSVRHAAVLLGSGTLANDVVAAQLRRRVSKGLILANGEFGERLVDQAARAGLQFDIYRRPWGMPFEVKRLAAFLSERPAWLWFVHCETSTGMLNDLGAIATLCRASGTEVCVDAISSLGTVPLNLQDVAFATAVSGKALGAYPGLGIVLHRDRPMPGEACPRYLDLALYGNAEPPFTHSSNLVEALAAALAEIGAARYQSLARDGKELRRLLREAGLECVAPEMHASPAVFTVALAPTVSSVDVAQRLASAGYTIAYRSQYLLQRNWIQLALMGQYSRASFPDLVALLREATERCAPSMAAAEGL